MHTQPMKVLVVAGGTREPIDDVRVITNKSTGRFGGAIADALKDAGTEVHLLASKLMVRIYQPNHHVQTFDSFEDLQQNIARLAVELKPDIVFMSAAVSDFSPVRTSGKIRSDAEELQLTLRRNPKLLASFREQFGIKTFLVGFKLLSGVTSEVLHDTAFTQVHDNHLNLTVANDLKAITEKEHPIMMVTPEDGAIPVSGSPKEVAQTLATFVLRRFRVQWHRSVSSDPIILLEQSIEQKNSVDTLLQFAQSAQLLPDNSGNVSVRLGESMVVTPRGVRKSCLVADDLVPVKVDLLGRMVHYSGDRKPSIDSGVLARIYDAFPKGEATLHTHHALVIPDARTRFPYPCGVVEEAKEVIDVVRHEMSTGKLQASSSFSVELIHHGTLFVFTEGQIERVVKMWDEARSQYIAHLHQVGVELYVKAALSGDTETIRMSPIFHGVIVIGVLVELPRENAVVPYLLREYRGDGMGETIVDMLENQKRAIAVHRNCNAVDYYLKRGWQIVRLICGGNVSILEPPSYDDARKSATVCLYDPDARKVLLGRRLVIPWENHWAFPGGGIDEKETPYQAALRELKEEMRIVLPEDAKPVEVRQFFVGSEGRVYVVDCHILHVRADTLDPQSTEEMEPKWVSINDALRVRPMGLGTRRILRLLSQM